MILFAVPCLLGDLQIFQIPNTPLLATFGRKSHPLLLDRSQIGEQVHVSSVLYWTSSG